MPFNLPRRFVISAIILFVLLVAFVMSGCSQLSKKESSVDKKFSAMIPELNLRYEKLSKAIEIAETVGGPRDVTTDGKKLIKDYERAKKTKDENGILETSRELETIVGRLRANVSSSPRLSSSAELAAAMEDLEKSVPGSKVRNEYVDAVNAYEDARTSWRNLLSSMIGGFSSPSQLEFSQKVEQQ